MVTPQQIPHVTVKTRIRDESVSGENPYRWEDVLSAEIFAEKKIVAFGLPGAFTPICDSAHLPGYEAHYDEFKDLGIDEIYCVATNDAFVMKRWSDSLGIRKVKLLPDGNNDFTRLMGMLVKKENLGFGYRSWRYSMLVENGEITKMFIEPGFADNYAEDPFEVSDAGTMLTHLRGLKS